MNITLTMFIWIIQLVYASDIHVCCVMKDPIIYMDKAN